MKRSLITLAAFTLTYLLFLLLGAFSVRQSLLLAGITTFVFNFYYMWIVSEFKRPATFTPFDIHIEPHWDKLLVAHGVIEEAEWHRLWSSLLATHQPGKYNVLVNDIKWTVLAPNVCFDHGKHSFASRLWTWIEIPEVQVPQHGRPVTPTFYVGWSHGAVLKGSAFERSWLILGSLDLGLRTKETLRGEKSDILARLPVTIFHEYVVGKNLPKATHELQRSLALSGWECEEHEFDYGGPPRGHVLRHKYFTVSLGPI